MKKLLSLAFTLLSVVVFAQEFEGKIVYKNKYESKFENISGQQFTSMMGSNQVYFYKNGNYKSVTNGSLLQWQIYKTKDNKIYSKVSNSENVVTNDGTENQDQILKVEINKGVTTILGYLCDEIVLTCTSGIQKYYYNSTIAVDDTLFEKHLYGNWYEYIKHAKALPLKIIMDNRQFTMTSIATEITEQKVDEKEFDLP